MSTQLWHVTKVFGKLGRYNSNTQHKPLNHNYGWPFNLLLHPPPKIFHQQCIFLPELSNPLEHPYLQSRLLAHHPSLMSYPTIIHPLYVPPLLTLPPLCLHFPLSSMPSYPPYHQSLYSHSSPISCLHSLIPPLLFTHMSIVIPTPPHLI